MITIEFNGQSSTDAKFDIESIMRVGRRLSIGHNARLFSITERDGMLFQGKDRRPYRISFRIMIKSDSYEAKRAAAREISAWLDIDDLAPLIASDEPDKQYQAVTVDEIPLEEIALLGFFDVTFLVPSSYAEAVSTKNTSRNSTNEGTAKCPCIITVTVEIGADFFLGETFVVPFTGESFTDGLKLTLGDEYLLLLGTFVEDDVIVFDTQKRLVTVNDVDSRAYLYLTSTWFKLPPGDFEIISEPSDNLIINVEFREVWK